MSNYITYSIQTKEELKEWIRNKLGYPLMTVELTDTQLDLSINDALEYYTEYADIEDNYILLNLSGYVENKGISVSGHNVTSIFSIDEEYGSGSNALFSTHNIMLQNGMYPSHYGHGSMLTYQLACDFSDLSRRMTANRFDFNFDVHNQRLKLWPDPISNGVYGYMVIGAKVIPPENELFGNRIVKKLALASSKMMLGVVRKKFENIVLPGGGSVDISIGDEGKEEWDKYTDELISEAMPHGSMVIG